MLTALKSVLNGLLWATVGFTLFSASGLILHPLGVEDYFVKGNPGESLQATRLSLVLCGVLVLTGFLWGIRSTYQPLLRCKVRRQINPPTNGVVAKHDSAP